MISKLDRPDVDAATAAPLDRAPGATAGTGAPAWRRRLAFKNIGVVYVWLGIIALFAVWVPETFPNLATAAQILHGNAITALTGLALASAPQWAVTCSSASS